MVLLVSWCMLVSLSHDRLAEGSSLVFVCFLSDSTQDLGQWNVLRRKGCFGQNMAILAMIMLTMLTRVGVVRSLRYKTSASWKSPRLALLIWLLADGIGVFLGLLYGVDLHRMRYQLCAKVGSVAEKGKVERAISV